MSDPVCRCSSPPSSPTRGLGHPTPTLIKAVKSNPKTKSDLPLMTADSGGGPLVSWNSGEARRRMGKVIAFGASPTLSSMALRFKKAWTFFVPLLFIAKHSRFRPSLTRQRPPCPVPSNAVSQTFHQSGRAYLASVYTTGKVKRVCHQERVSSLLLLA